MDVDAVIAEALATSAQSTQAETPQNPKADNTTPPESPEAKPQEQASKEEAEQDIREKPDSELTPEQLAKREANRLSHQNSKNARLRRENRELKALLQQQTSQTKSNQADASDSPPVESDYNSLYDFVNAQIRYEKKQAEKQQAQEEAKAAPSQQSQKFTDEKTIQRVNEITAQEAEFSKAVPDYVKLIEKNKEFFADVPDDLKEGLLVADNAPLALYALMKELLLFYLQLRHFNLQITFIVFQLLL